MKRYHRKVVGKMKNVSLELGILGNMKNDCGNGTKRSVVLDAIYGS